ncbi:RlfA, partial [Campylobacter coli]
MESIKEFKIFCDESNHLFYKDNPTLRSKVMVLGALKVPSSEIIKINK